jgi:hypothetical protein
VYAGSLDDKNRKLLVRTNTSAAYAPGYLLFVDGDTLLGQAFDAERLEVSGQPFLIAEHVGSSSASESAISASRTLGSSWCSRLMISSWSLSEAESCPGGRATARSCST